jgi:hypothetical protein
MPVRGGELTQSLDQHYFEEGGSDRSRFGRVFGCIDGVEAREPYAQWNTVCAFLHE